MRQHCARVGLAAMGAGRRVAAGSLTHRIRGVPTLAVTASTASLAMGSMLAYRSSVTTASASMAEGSAGTPVRRSRLTDEKLRPLLEMAVLAKDNAYSPYSKFRVGAVLLTADGHTHTGCNVENASYGLTICAERTALTKAVSEGDRKFTTIVVATDVLDSWLPPCGACRQFIAEFGLDIEVILVKPDLSYMVTTAGELLPGAFVPVDLNRPRLPATE